MFRLFTAVSLIALTTACGSGTQPFKFAATDATDTTGTDTTNTDTGTTGDEGTGATNALNTGTARPPGAGEVTRSADITRYESANADSGGLVKNVSYDAEERTFTVDGLAFDGANIYKRDTQVPSLNGYAVFEADAITYDDLTGTPIGQIRPYRALFGVSNNDDADGEPRTSFAIVRTGGYTQYGFGGFIYKRNDGVVLPDTGQASFSGDYAGIRVFNGRGGMEYTRGDMTVDIDFRDFNANDAVKGTVSRREAWTTDNLEIPLDETDGLVLPNLNFTIVEGVETLTENGEISGTLQNYIQDADGAPELYEQGTYYGIMSGDATTLDGGGGEIVGVFVVTSDDPRYEGVTAQETGGFILYR